MSQPDSEDRILARDATPDDENLPTGNADPLTETELEDILYGEGDPDERMARLLELRSHLLGRQSAEFADRDADELLADVDRAILTLRGDRGSPVELDDFGGEETDHRETLSPDSDELEDIEKDDEASLTDGAEPLTDYTLDPEEWDDEGDFDVHRGVR